MRYGVQAPIPAVVGPWYRRVRKWGPRYGQVSRSIVTHRMDGTLESSDSWLRATASGSASAHFGIGHWNGVPQVRQWVDTAYAAWTWAASPTDRPTPVGYKVFGDLLVPRSGWPPVYSRADLNRYVITIEVEGFYYQRWHPDLIPLYKQLVKAIVNAHGPQWMTGHGDLSSKPCPGFTTWQAAIPGVYGTRYGAAPTNLLTESVEMAILDKLTIPGDVGRLFDVKAGVQLYKGPGSAYPKHWKTTVPVKYRLVGFSPNGWVAASNPNDPTGVFFVPPAH